MRRGVCGCWCRSGRGAVRESKSVEVVGGDVSEPVWYASGESVGSASDQQSVQIGQLLQIGRYGSRQPVAAESQGLQIGHVAQLGRYGSCESVASESEMLQVDQISQPGGYGSAQLVVSEVDSYEFIQRLQLRRHSAGESFSCQGYLSDALDAADRFDLDAVPLCHGYVCAPVEVS